MKIHPYACAHCQESFMTPNHLVSHVQNKHFQVKYSNSRKEDAITVIELDKETSVSDQSNVNKRDQIDIDSKINKRFNKHNEKHFSCRICGKIYSIYISFYQHSITHKEKKHSCEICKKKFTHAQGLERHKRIHTGEKPFECKFCKKKFKQKFHRVGHERTHTSEKPYPCNFCDRKFNLMQNKISHERIHTGERPYTCSICDKKFTVKKNREKHEKTHIGENLMPVNL